MATTTRYLVGKSEGLVASTDVVLEVSGARFPAHSVLLACSCKFFDDLFFDPPGKEASCRDSNLGTGLAEPKRVVLAPQGSESALTPENVELFLYYMYSGGHKLASLTEKDAELLLPVADFFADEALMQRCVQLLSDPDRLQAMRYKGEFSNALETELRTAARFRLRSMMAQCLPYYVEAFHYCTITAMGEWADMTLMKVVLQALNTSVVQAGDIGLRSSDFDVGSMNPRPAVSSRWFLDALAKEGWGR